MTSLSTDEAEVIKETDTSLLIAFVQGAKWWEWKSRDATMWQSDQRDAEKAAIARLENGTLGVKK